jgi:hypothetical protein
VPGGQWSVKSAIKKERFASAITGEDKKEAAGMDHEDCKTDASPFCVDLDGDFCVCNNRAVSTCRVVGISHHSHSDKPIDFLVA